MFGVRVSGGHLCEAEAPTEVVAETVAAVWLTEGLLEIEAYLQIKNYICKISAAVQIFAPLLRGRRFFRHCDTVHSP